jgi:hypothetical protein
MSSASSGREAFEAEARRLLAEMDGLFGHFFDWLADRYDPVSGGFFYAASSRRMAGGFGPDIESTAQAVNILERVGLLAAMPAPMREGLIRFFQERQDPASGYFYDGHPNMREDEVMVARAMGYSLGVLRKLGAAPLHPLPAAERAPGYLDSPEAYVRWLRSVDLSHSWRGCDRLAVSSVYVRQLEPGRREIFLRTALEEFTRLQDPVTGLWGGGGWYVRISGTFKLHTFYSAFDVPMPRVREIYGSILYTLRTERATDMCFVRNPVHLLSYLRPHLEPDVSPDELLDILRTTKDNLARLLRGDGGFSREISGSVEAPNVAQVKAGETYPDLPKPVPLGLGEVEGDMNAGTQAVLVRTLCYRLAGLGEPAWTPYADGFYERLGWR